MEALLTRREFLQWTVAAGVGAVAAERLGVAGWAAPTSYKKNVGDVLRFSP
jgi:hypothetical protein